MSAAVRSASSSAFSIEERVLSTMGLIRSSSFARLMRCSKFLGPVEGLWDMNGRLMSVSITVESSIFAFSAASLTRVMAVGSPDRGLCLPSS